MIIAINKDIQEISTTELLSMGDGDSLILNEIVRGKPTYNMVLVKPNGLRRVIVNCNDIDELTEIAYQLYEAVERGDRIFYL